VPYLIDGHNLIPRIPDLSLEALDDEIQLAELLQEFCRRQHKRAEVFFDNAPPGGVRAHNLGLVITRFVRQGTTADEAMRGRLQRLGREARNWTVVSSDQAVQSAARAAQAQTITSEAFARLLLQVLEESGADVGKNPDFSIGQEELDDWLKLFGNGEGH
jgi:predicted RNA-binding protein with PIN domain